MNIYTGHNKHEVKVNGKKLPLRLDIVNHSPTGFSWGYGGSGPAQLALAIMVNEFGEDLEKHPCHYQNFKFRVIGALKEDSFELNSNEIKKICKQIQEEKNERSI